MMQIYASFNKKVTIYSTSVSSYSTSKYCNNQLNMKEKK
jgi:hypothetical protein